MPSEWAKKKAVELFRLWGWEIYHGPDGDQCLAEALDAARQRGRIEWMEEAAKKRALAIRKRIEEMENGQ